MKQWIEWALAGVILPVGVGCSSSSSGGSPEATKTDAEYQTSIAEEMHDSLQKDLEDLVQGAKDIQSAAPAHAWDASDPAVATMKDAWIRARHAYEHVEGATAQVFPDIDVALDGRVEDFSSTGSGVLGLGSDMFGDKAMTGLHAIERILYASTTPESVKEYETSLGYVPPQAYPSTDAQADEFKNQLCANLVGSATMLLEGWKPGVADIVSAYKGLTGLMNEQKEKVGKAGLHQEESRYSQRTMDDLRENLQGTMSIYALFQPWIRSKSGGTDVDAKVEAGFASLQAIYASPAYSGDAFPAPPATWSDVQPSAADLRTSFGRLYTAVEGAVDVTKEGSTVFEMNAAAGLCGLPTFGQ